MKALLVVDLQNDFLPGGALAVAGGDLIIPVINSLQKRFDLIVATQDWHPVAHQSFASQHPEHNCFDLVDLHGLPQVLWPDHCIQGTFGAEFSSLWNSKSVAAIFRKGMQTQVDSYSGFFDNGKRFKTGLGAYLKDQGVSSLYICGLAADFCVYYSAVDAAALGFKTYFLNFATQAIAVDGLQNAKQKMLEKGIVIVNSLEELL